MAMNRRVFMRSVGTLVWAAAYGCATPRTDVRPMATREQSLPVWRERIRSILEKGVVPIIDTEATYNRAMDLGYIMDQMDRLGVAQVAFAPHARLGSQESLRMHRQYPAYFIPTTADGSSPHWYHDPDNFVACVAIPGFP